MTHMRTCCTKQLCPHAPVQPMHISGAASCHHLLHMVFAHSTGDCPVLLPVTELHSAQRQWTPSVQSAAGCRPVHQQDEPASQTPVGQRKAANTQLGIKFHLLCTCFISRGCLVACAGVLYVLKHTSTHAAQSRVNLGCCQSICLTVGRLQHGDVRTQLQHLRMEPMCAATVGD
jgi:hypothetical protein